MSYNEADVVRLARLKGKKSLYSFDIIALQYLFSVD
jgi:hypothetical protein